MSADPSDPASKVDVERRRVPLERKISLKFKEFRGFITEYSSNLSMGGMFIRTTAPKPVGTIFDFELSLTDDFKLVQGIGEVIWVREADDGPERPTGMGVRFLDLSAESRRLIQRIVEEQVAHGGTPFELEPPGFPPPPRRPAVGGAAPRPGGQSTLFHPTAAPVAPAALPPSRPVGRPVTGVAAPPGGAQTPAARPKPPPAGGPSSAGPSPAPAVRQAGPPAVRPLPPRPSVVEPQPPAALPARSSRPLAPAAGPTSGDAIPDLGPPEPLVPELQRDHADVLQDLSESWEGEALEGFSLEDTDAAVEVSGALVVPPTQSAPLADLHEDPTLLRGSRAQLLAASPPAPSPWTPPAPPPGAASGQAPAVVRGRGLPSGFDEVARAFAEPGRPLELQGETVRLAPLEVPPAPAPPPIAPAAAAAAPLPKAPPRVAPIARPAVPARRPAPRRRTSWMPLAAALVLALAAGAGLVYLRFPELLPGWAGAPRLAEPEGATGAEGTPASPARAASLRGAPTASEPAAGVPSPVSPEAAGPPVAPLPPGVPSVSPQPGAGSPGSARVPAAGPQARNGAVATSRFTSIEEIWGQRTAAGTVVTIVTNGAVPADAFSHFRLEGESPREVIRVRGVDDSYRRSTIAVATGEVKQVRLGYHARPGGNELHVVVDLNSPRVGLVRATPVDNRIELLFAVQ